MTTQLQDAGPVVACPRCGHKFALTDVLVGPIEAKVAQRLEAEYEKRAADSRKASADYTREYATFDDETIAAVDKFRKDRNLDYQGDAPGLVDARLIDALRSAYFEKRKSSKR